MLLEYMLHLIAHIQSISRQVVDLPFCALPVTSTADTSVYHCRLLLYLFCILCSNNACVQINPIELSEYSHSLCSSLSLTYLNWHIFEYRPKETLTYTLVVVSSPALYGYPSSEGDIVAGCELKISFGTHRWKHEDWKSMT